MKRWYPSLVPGRMPLPLAWLVAFFSVGVSFVWITLSFEGIVIPLQVGDTVRFEQVRQSADSTTAHFFTVERQDLARSVGLGDEGAEEVDIDFNLDDGRFGSDPPGGPLDLYEISFAEPGLFIISDSAHPRGHGSARFVVTESAGGGGRLIVTGAFIVEDARFELRTSETETQFGYPPGSLVSSRSPAEPVIQLILIGSVLIAPVIAFFRRRRWWLWGIIGIVMGLLGAVQPVLTSVTVVGAVLLAARPRPAAAVTEAEPPEEDERGEEPPDAEDEGPPGPPTQDQRTLPPPVPATPPRPRPEHGRRRRRY